MFEKRHQPLASTKTFLVRLAQSIILGLSLIANHAYVLSNGYHYFESMSWIDAFANAAMILSGMGPLTPLVTKGGKIFAGLYALFSGLAFILLIGIVFSPIVHRFFHKFHLDTDDGSK